MTPPVFSTVKTCNQHKMTRLNEPKSQLSHVGSNELLPKTKVVEFDKINNFCVQNFSSSNMKFGVNPEKQVGSLNLNSNLMNPLFFGVNSKFHVVT